MGKAKRRGNNKAQRIAAMLEESGVVQMTAERYNAYISWTRLPVAGDYCTELEFFSDKSEILIGVLIKDHTDRDFGFIMLGRDTKGRFRCIDTGDSMTRTNARHALFALFKSYIASGEKVFSQGDEETDKTGVDLFSTNLPVNKQRPAFYRLCSSPHWVPARAIMSEMMRSFIDIDGNFVEQFQTKAFDSRIWELYLYAALQELGLFVKRDHEAPDFEVSNTTSKVFIEAVIVGPSEKDTPLDRTEDDMPIMHTLEDIEELLKTKIPIRFGSSLYSKLNRKTKYWDLEHVNGYPLIFAIADFHEDQSMIWTPSALFEYLYGVTHKHRFDDIGQLVITPLKVETHEYKSKVIPSGFFLQPGAENVSAVLFSSSGTISKFNRMGMLAGFGLPNQKIFRSGLKHCHDPNAVMPEVFSHEVKQGVVTETWAEGLNMCHNPNAKHPVNPSMFPGIAHHWFRGGQVESWLPEFCVHSSLTHNVMIDDKDGNIFKE